MLSKRDADLVDWRATRISVVEDLDVELELYTSVVFSSDDNRASESYKHGQEWGSKIVIEALDANFKAFIQEPAKETPAPSHTRQFR